MPLLPVCHVRVAATRAERFESLREFVRRPPGCALASDCRNLALHDVPDVISPANSVVTGGNSPRAQANAPAVATTSIIVTTTTQSTR